MEVIGGEMSKTTENNAYIERYQIMSTTGRLYTRDMLARAVARVTGPGYGKQIRRWLDDDAFMSWRRGSIPGAVARDIFIKIASGSEGSGE